MRGLEAGFHLDISGMQAADDKMLEPGWQELPLALGSTSVALCRAPDYTRVLRWPGHVTINKQLWVLFKKLTEAALRLSQQITRGWGKFG